MKKIPFLLSVLAFILCSSFSFSQTAPTFTSTPVTSVDEGDTYIYTITTNDAEGDVVSIIAPTLPSWLSLASILIERFVGSDTNTAGFANGTGTAAQFNSPRGIAVDASGNLYVTDFENHLIRKITPEGVVSTFAGSTVGYADGVGTSAQFNFPTGITVDALGNVYVADFRNYRIRKITPAGVVSTLAGSSTRGSTDGTGTAAQFNSPIGITVDTSGNVYVVDQDNNNIRKITPVGVVTTLAGLAGTNGNTDGTGSAARFERPERAAVDASGNVYVADRQNHRIRKITSAGVVSTLAGSTRGSADGLGTLAQFNFPSGVAVDNSGNVYVSDQGNKSIRKITPAGQVSTLTSSFNTPVDVAINTSRTIYVTDANLHSIHFIQEETVLSGTAPNVAGMHNVVLEANDGNGGTVQQSFTITVNDITPPVFENSTPNASSITRTDFTLATDIDEAGSIYYVVVADGATAPTSTEVIAGTGSGGTGEITSGNAAVSTGGFTHNFSVTGLTPSTAYDIYVVAQDDETTPNVQTTPTKLDVTTNTSPTFTSTPVTSINERDPYTYNIITNDTDGHPVTITATSLPSWLSLTSIGVVTTFAGSVGSIGSMDGTGTAASFSEPWGVAVDASGNVYVADTNNRLIRKITPAGEVSTLAGSSLGNMDGTGTAARFSSPAGIALDTSGNIYVSDRGNHSIRKITPAGVVTTLAGTGSPGSTNGTGTAASFDFPGEVALDASGNVYVADVLNNLIRKITPTGVVSTFAGSGGFGSNDGTGTAASFRNPTGVAVDAFDNVYVVDQRSHLIRKITPTGVVSTLAGSGSAGSSDGTGTAASFNFPFGIAVDAFDNIYVTDQNNSLIRSITPAGVVSTLAGSGSIGSTNGTGTAASFFVPIGVALDASGNVYIADALNHLIRKIGFSYSLTGFSIGQAGGHSVVLEANDGNGGTVQQSFTITVIDIPPTGYSVTIDQDPINTTNVNAVSFTFENAEVGATYDYTFSTSGGVETVTGSGTINTTTDQITGIDLSSLTDGTITLSATLTDISNNVGTAVTDTSSKETVIPTGYSVTIDQDPINVTNENAVSFTFADAEVGTTYDYTFSTSGGSETVTGTGTISTVTDQITGINLSGISDGTITLSATLTDTHLNVGTAVTDTATKVNTAPTFTSTPITSIDEGDAYTYSIITNDLDLDGVTLTTPTLPGWLSLNFELGGNVTTLAGSASAGNDNGNGTAASFNNPWGATVDVNGNVYIADQTNHLIRKITPNGDVTTLAGSGSAGSDNGNGTAASFNSPWGVDVDLAGNVYVADRSNGLIRKITPSGDVTTITSAIPIPTDVAVDATGNLYVSSQSRTIYKITPTGTVITTITSSSFARPFGIAVDATGNVFVADLARRRVFKITPAGVVTTFATGFLAPWGIAADAIGNLYVADFRGGVSKVDSSGNVTNYASTSGAGGITISSNPRDVAVDPTGNLILAGTSHLIQKITLPSSELIGDSTGQAGDHPVVLEANDGNGGIVQQSFTITVNDITAPTGYSVTIDQDLIDATNADAVSFTFADAEVGTTYDYTFSSSGGSGAVTGTGTISTVTDQITGIDLSGISDGTISLSVTLTDPSNNVGAAVSDTSTKNTIVAITVDDPSNAETDSGTATLQYTVSLETAALETITVDVATSDGSASASSDYTALTTTTLTFMAGETTQTVDVSINGDTTLEADETINLSLSNATGPGMITDATGVGTITNDDVASVTIADISGNEDDGDITITATLDNAVDGGFSVDVSTADGTATTGDSDYTAVTAETLTFAGNAGETQTFTVTPIADTRFEDTETLTVSQSNLTGTGLSVTITDGATVTITNDDTAPTVTLSVNNSSIDEVSGTATLTATLSAISGKDVTVDLGYSGTATNGTDYNSSASTSITINAGDLSANAAVIITTIDDPNPETNETIIVDIIGVTDGTENGTQQQTITINDDDIPNVEFIATSSNGLESVSSADLIVHTNIVSALTVTVDYTVTGTATGGGVDHTLADGTVTWTPGLMYQLISISGIVDDTILEANETVIITLSNPSNAVLGTNTVHTYTITNNDVASVTIADISGNEDDGDITITATLDNAVDGSFSVDISTADGTATTADSDYTAVTGETLTFAGNAGETQTFTISPTVDTKLETDEALTVSQRNLAGTTLGVVITDEATVTITNDDTATATIEDITVNEADGTATLIATLDNPVQDGFVLHATTVDGTAIAPDDFTAITDQAVATFAGTPGETQNIVLTLTDDMLGESVEELTMTLSSISGTTLAASIDITDTATITINDDDAPVVTMVSVPADGTYGIGDNLDFSVTFTNPASITGAPSIPLTIGSTTIQAVLNGTVTDALTADFRYTVVEGDLDTDGIVVGSEINLNAGSIIGSSGIPAILTLNGVGDTSNVNVDGIKPTVVITADAAIPTNIAFTATITFSEDVTGFEVADLSVTNGTASDFTITSATVYTALITPTVDGIVTVDVNAEVAQDLVGNDNLAATQYSVLYDATNPTVSISSTVPDPTNMPFIIDIVFDEDVTGFDITDLSVTNGTASAFTITSASIYSALITPTISDDVMVDIAMGAAQDAATNPNDAARFSIEYDDIPPLPPQITHVSDYTCTGDTSMTGDNTLEISGIAEQSSMIEVFQDGSSIGTTITLDTGFYTFDHTATTLADGSYSFTVTATDIAGNTSDLSAPLNITINSVDTDGDGLPDFCDDDDDGNGVVDADEDCDGDGIIDSLDTDNSSCSNSIQQIKSYGFSPNGDGVNDGWFIENITSFPNNLVQVFNRSGKLVFKQRSYQNDWEGISNQISNNGSNKPLPVGPYLFIIDLGDGSQPTRGWLYINY